MIPQYGTLEISRSRFGRNLQALRQRLDPGVRLCALIKANAYGHGIEPIAGLLREHQVEWVSVYSLEEALELCDRAAATGFKILTLAPQVWMSPSPATIRRLLDAQGVEIRLNVTDGLTARCLSQSVSAVAPAMRWPVHVQVDTGLTRAGADVSAARDLAALVAGLPGLGLEGVFAHFSHGDVPGHPTIVEQYQALWRVAEPLKHMDPSLLVHLQNSGGLWNLPAQGPLALDMVRIGIAMYGLQPSMKDPIPGLLPVARLVAPVLSVHQRPAGTGVGYGHTFITRRASRLAVVPVGYADGYPRGLSNRCVAQVKDHQAAVVGRVSMDQIILDVTGEGQTSGGGASRTPASSATVEVGDEVVVMSWDPDDPNHLDRMACALGTIGYELATHLGTRLRRVVVD